MIIYLLVSTLYMFVFLNAPFKIAHIPYVIILENKNNW